MKDSLKLDFSRFRSSGLKFGGRVELKLYSDFIVFWIYHSSLSQIVGLVEVVD